MEGEKGRREGEKERIKKEQEGGGEREYRQTILSRSPLSYCHL